MINVLIDDVQSDLRVVPRRYRQCTRAAHKLGDLSSAWFSDFERLLKDLADDFPQVFDPKRNPDPPALPGKKVPSDATAGTQRIGSGLAT